MAHWWVNHKQTFKEELEGGYIWSPQENKNGSRNQTYINLTRAKVGDVVFSYASAVIKAVGLVESSYQTSDKPVEFGSKGDGWDQKGWLVKINWEVIFEPLVPKKYLDEIVPLLPEKYAPIQSNGNGNQGCYLAEISEPLSDLLLQKIVSFNPEFPIALDDDRRELDEVNIEQNILAQDAGDTEKEQLIKSRRGQGVFKMRVSSKEKRCRVTGVGFKAFLIASHIKPWAVCSNNERLDGDNGLLLSPHVDKLFDKGWISFTNSGDILCFDEKTKELMEAWGIDPGVNVGVFSNGQAIYLDYHRTKVFRKVCVV